MKRNITFFFLKHCGVWLQTFNSNFFLFSAIVKQCFKKYWWNLFELEKWLGFFFFYELKSINMLGGEKAIMYVIDMLDYQIHLYPFKILTFPNPLKYLPRLCLILEDTCQGCVWFWKILAKVVSDFGRCGPVPPSPSLLWGHPYQSTSIPVLSYHRVKYLGGCRLLKRFWVPSDEELN